jgi:cytochrome bd ubiquinol oxidase subunit I
MLPSLAAASPDLSDAGCPILPRMLARIQFAANISFHILFPTITIALGWVLLFFKLRYNATRRREAWMDAYRFWVKVFALSFALGVVSGITMSFQFGTNWPGFMETVGNIAGPLLAYEVLTAFFLEATFLGIMLFGFRRVPGWVHTTATVLVAFGTTLSAFWILVLNSWMHTPAGFEMRDGVAMRPTGGRSSSTRPCPTASRTCCWPRA